MLLSNSREVFDALREDFANEVRRKVTLGCNVPFMLTLIPVKVYLQTRTRLG